MTNAKTSYSFSSRTSDVDLRLITEDATDDTSILCITHDGESFTLVRRSFLDRAVAILGSAAVPEKTLLTPRANLDRADGALRVFGCGPLTGWRGEDGDSTTAWREILARVEFAERATFTTLVVGY